MTTQELLDLKATIEAQTGFVCYEDSANNQLTFYGTSDKLAAFKTLINSKPLKTGSIVYLLDTGDTYMWSEYKKTWY